MEQNKNEGPPETPEEKGRLGVNVLKVLFLVVVLTVFWVLFDRWLSLE